jgi:hypothetical protein
MIGRPILRAEEVWMEWMYSLNDVEEDVDEGDWTLPYRNDDEDDDTDSIDDNDEYQQTVLDYNHAMPYFTMDDARRYQRVWC